MKIKLLLCALLCCAAPALALPPGIRTPSPSISGAGTYPGVTDNCGFTANSDGWVGFWLYNDSAMAPRTDLVVKSGEYYPLRVRDLVLFPTSQGGASGITLDTNSQCGFTRSFFVDDACETNPDRPANSDPEIVPPGPNLPFNSMFYATADCETDIIRWGVDDLTNWVTIQHQKGFPYAAPGGVRRCRFVEGCYTPLTFVAP